MTTSLEFSADVVAPSSLSQGDIALWNKMVCDNRALRVSFLSYSFARAAEAAFRDVHVCRIRSRDRPVAFFPFQFSSSVHRFFGIGKRIGGELSDYFGIVAEPGFVVDPLQLIHLARLNALMFTHLNDCQRMFGLTGEDAEIGYLVEFPSGGVEYWKEKQACDKKFTSDTERRERKLIREYGPLKFVFRESNWQPALEHVIQAKREQYIRTRVHDPLDDSRVRNFLQILAGTSDPLCRATISTLHAGDTWIASHFGLVCTSTLHYWFPVYNPLMASFAPGRLLMKSIVDSATENGLSCIDRGAGDSVAKRDFATSHHYFQRGLWRRANFGSAGYQLGLSMGWRASSAIRAIRKQTDFKPDRDQ